MAAWREIACPRCGRAVRIPWLWVLGLEMIFYCKGCKQHLKINYKWGAVLAGVGWALALAAVQLVGFFTSAVTVALAAAAFVPLGVGCSFFLRKIALRRACRRKTEK